MQNLRPQILADCLGLAIGETSTRLSPAQGLRLGASFRAALSEEPALLEAPPSPRRPRKNSTSKA